MRLVLIVFLFSLPLIHAVGCSSSNNSGADNDPFDTYQDCFNEHHTTEGFSGQRAIEICCIDHPIGSAAMNTVCGDTAASCMTYVTANLSAPDVTPADITTACSDYVVDRAG